MPILSIFPGNDFGGIAGFGGNFSKFRSSVDDDGYGFSIKTQGLRHLPPIRKKGQTPLAAGQPGSGKEKNMRRLLIPLGALGLMAGFVIGCQKPKIHGICDCSYQDPCCTRQPWVTAPPHPVIPPDIQMEPPRELPKKEKKKL